MASSALGTKRECPECGAKFFDLGATPVVCPKCKHTLKTDVKPKAKKVAPPKHLPKPKKPVKAFDDDAVGSDEEIDEAGAVGELEDLDELDDAPEVISLEEVEEHHEDKEVDPNSDDAEDEMFLEDLAGEADLFDTIEIDEDDESEDDDAAEEDDGDNEDDRPSRARKRTNP